jgi:ABC-type sugar transport system substrate-binding protein
VAAAITTVKQYFTPLGASVTVDGIASANPQAESNAIQDAATRGGYDGYLILPQNGAGDVSATKDLIAKGKPVVNANIPIGTQLCSTTQQVPGLAGAAFTPVCDAGTALGHLVTQACTGISHCRVMWTVGIPGFPGEGAELTGIKAAVKKIGATLIETSPTMYDPNTSINVVTNALAANKNIDVFIATAEQEYRGYLHAVKAGGTPAKKVIAIGATQAEVAAIKAGTVFGTQLATGMPASDARYASQILGHALSTGDKSYVYINTLQKRGLPGYITKANESAWSGFTPEWSLSGAA